MSTVGSSFAAFVDTSRPSNGVVPAGVVPPAGAHGAEHDRHSEVRRLDQMLTDPRWRLEAIRLALATIDRYDPARHRLTGKAASYHALFRAVAPCEYRACPNVRAAAQVLDILIAERYS